MVYQIYKDCFCCLLLQQELEQQNELLYNTKAVLEKQINALNSKAEKLGKLALILLKVSQHICVQVCNHDLLTMNLDLWNN